MYHTKEPTDSPRPDPPKGSSTSLQAREFLEELKLSNEGLLEKFEIICKRYEVYAEVFATLSIERNKQFAKDNPQEFVTKLYELVNMWTKKIQFINQ